MNIERLSFFLLILSLTCSYKLLNKTHFSCDQDKFLSLNKINDDFCDCEDGSDETKTNACINGVFTCVNRFYLPVNISSYKVNDGICDCCDGSDEFKTKNCPKTCIELSKNDYTQFLIKYKTIENFSKDLEDDITLQYINETINKTKNIIQTYKDIEEINEKYFLILSYLNKIRKTIGDDEFEKNPDLKDENGFVIRELKHALNNLGEEIYQKEQLLEENANFINQMLFFIYFKGKEQECMEAKYKSMTISVCLMGRIEISGYRGRYYIRRYLGYKSNKISHFNRIENNTIHYTNGDQCAYYNKKRTAKINIECSNEETIEFVRKNNACEYEMIYKTKFGCNFQNLSEMRNKILLYLKEI